MISNKLNDEHEVVVTLREKKLALFTKRLVFEWTVTCTK